MQPTKDSHILRDERGTDVVGVSDYYDDLLTYIRDMFLCRFDCTFSSDQFVHAQDFTITNLCALIELAQSKNSI